jgi:hypothetical protein
MCSAEQKPISFVQVLASQSASVWQVMVQIRAL